MIHVLLEEALYDEEFVRDWTNAPFLVREDTQALVTGLNLSPSGTSNSFVVWDDTRDGPVVWQAETGYAEDGVSPRLFGRFDCRLADGSVIRCRPVFELLKELAAQYAPERSGHITWVAEETVRKAVRLFVGAKPSAYSIWTGIEQQTSAMQINRAISCFYALTGQFDRRGSNVMFAPTPTRPVSGESFLSQENRKRRLGLADHPLGPPSDPGFVQAKTVYDAIIDEDPYPVRLH